MKSLKTFLALLLITTQVLYGDAVIFSGNDVKALKSNLDLNGNAKILSGSVDPTSSATSAPVGSLYLNTSTGKTYRKLDSGSSTNWVIVSSGGDAGTNYVSNGDAEANTTGWATYADAAGASPVDCTGGSPTLTYTRSTSSPLRGIANFLVTKDAANRQGEGASYAFSVDRADLAKPLSISFDYEVGSGTFVAGTDAVDSDILVYVYDVTNSALIQPAGYKLPGLSGQFKFSGSFQTASNSQSYRLCLHQAKTGTSAYTLKVDNVKVGPNALVQGAPVSDWISFTPTGSWSSNTTYTGYFRRVGDSAEVDVKVATSGAPTSANLTVNLPSGLVIDTAKLSEASTKDISFGLATTTLSSVNRQGFVGYSSTTSVLVYALDTTSSNGSVVVVTQAVPNTFGSGDSVALNFKVPIVGWGTSLALSNDTDTRVVAALYNTASGTPSGTPSVVKYTTKVVDTHGAYSTSTGLYTAPVSGYYDISGQVRINGTFTANQYTESLIYINGVVKYIGEQRMGSASNTTGIPLVSIKGAFLNAGDTVAIYGASNGSSPSYDASTTYEYISIARVSGPATIAASETVSFRAGATATAVNSGSNATLVFPTVAFDTHGAYNSSTGIFTAPISGKYSVRCVVLGSGTIAAGAADNRILLSVLQNASTVLLKREPARTTSAYTPTGDVGGTVRLLARDTVKINLDNTLGSTFTPDGSASGSYFEVTRVGSY